MDPGYIKIAVTVLLAVLGWVTGHYFTDRRAIAAKRRDIRLEHLINSYRFFEQDLSNRKDFSKDTSAGLEAAISEIQLFGSKEQVELAKQLADAIRSDQENVMVDSLINSLRNDIRKQLDLEPVTGNVHYVRLNAQ